MKRIAWVTANFGGIDNRIDEIEQKLPDGYEYSRFYYTEENSPFPFPNLDDRMRAKWFKMNWWKLPEANGFDAVVWTDANIELLPGALWQFVYPIFTNGASFVINPHHERATVTEELKFIEANIHTEYLGRRYAKQDLRAEYNYLVKRGMPTDAPLYSCNVFAYEVRYNGWPMKAWWDTCIMFSNFDQQAFSFFASKMSDEYRQNLFDFGPGCNYYNNKYFIHHNHEAIK